MVIHAEQHEPSNGIVVLTIDRSPVNALDLSHLHLLTIRLRELAGDPDLRGVVLTGAGRAFCAGIDTRALAKGPGPERRVLYPAIDGMMNRLLDLPVPVGAAINGHALGGGLVLAMGADVRLAADTDCELGLPEVEVGAPFPPVPCELLARELDPSLLRRLALGGERLTPYQALRHDVVDEVVEPQELLPTTCDRVDRLASLPAFREIKRQFRALPTGRSA